MEESTQRKKKGEKKLPLSPIRPIACAAITASGPTACTTTFRADVSLSIDHQGGGRRNRVTTSAVSLSVAHQGGGKGEKITSTRTVSLSVAHQGGGKGEKITTTRTAEARRTAPPHHRKRPLDEGRIAGGEERWRRKFEGGEKV